MTTHSMTEVWRDVPGYEGSYQVSNMGRVKSLTRKVNSRFGKDRTVRERILNTTIYSNGYVYAALGAGIENRTTVHTLVAEMFVGPPIEGCIVHHIDEIKTNNIWTNLEYKTYKNHSGHHAVLGVYPLGVSKDGSRFRARTFSGGKRITIGRFNTAEEAGEAYKQFNN